MVVGIFFSCGPSGQDNKVDLPHLKVSENGRFLMTDSGDPFFWLGDTGWLLFSKLSREEAVQYLENRRAKGFNVIQVMVIHQLAMANYYGDSALVKGNVSNPLVTEGDKFQDSTAYDYWDHVDYILEMAEERGIYLGLVPVWGSNVRSGHVTLSEADQYSEWLAKRFGIRNNVIWLNGGDVKGSDYEEIWNLMGQNLNQHTEGQLITFHPFGRTNSSTWFHEKEWLDFNMFQSGHRRYDQDDTENAFGQDNWKYVAIDYSLRPVKPTLDGEPSYEGIPQGLHDPSEPYWNENDVRRYAYWSVFAGGFGFTYGHSAVMQMHKPGDTDPSYGVREYWTEAAEAPGALQMQHLKKLILSQPFLERVPDQSIISGDPGEQYNRLIATRGVDYAFIYTYNGRIIQVQLGKLKGDYIDASWYNPRNGEYSEIGKFNNKDVAEFDPPGEIMDGNDWVLVLESI